MRPRASVVRLRRSIAAVLALALTLAGTGCFGQREVEETAFILAIGVDQAPEGQYDVTFQMAVPAKTGDSEISVVVVTQRAKSIADAIANVAVTMNKDPSMNQVRLLVFGEALARAGVGPVIDFLTRAHETRLLIWVMVTAGLAADVLRLKARTDPIAANMLSGVQHEATDIGFAPQGTLLEFLDYLGSNARDPLTSRITPLPPESADTAGANPLMLDGAAVFRSDRLVGWLDRAETRGYLWLHGEADDTTVAFQDPQTGATGTFRVLVNTAKWVVAIDRNDPGGSRFTITIRVDAQVNELTGAPAIETSGDLSRLEQGLASLVRDEALAALRKSQVDFRADFIGLGERLRSKYSVANWSKIAPQWFDQYLPRVTVNVMTSFKLRRPGMTVSQLVPDMPR